MSNQINIQVKSSSLYFSNTFNSRLKSKATEEKEKTKVNNSEVLNQQNAFQIIQKHYSACMFYLHDHHRFNIVTSVKILCHNEFMSLNVYFNNSKKRTVIFRCFQTRISIWSSFEWKDHKKKLEKGVKSNTCGVLTCKWIHFRPNTFRSNPVVNLLWLYV